MLLYIFYWVLLLFNSLLANASIKLIYKLKSRLLVNDLLIKIISLAIVGWALLYIIEKKC